jgi:hypothetical protein
MALLPIRPNWSKRVSMLILTTALCGCIGKLMQRLGWSSCRTKLTFSSKQHPLDSTRQVLRNAKTLLIVTSSKECGDSDECNEEQEVQKKKEGVYKFRETQGGRDEPEAEGAEDPEDIERDAEEQVLRRSSTVGDDNADTVGSEDAGNTEDDEEAYDEDSGNSDTVGSEEELPATSSSPSASPAFSGSSSSPSPTARGIMMVGGYGILSLNRVYRDSSELTSTERKKLIFGSDQIKP